MTVETNALNHRVVKKTYENGSLSETRLFYFNQNWQCLEERVGTLTTADLTYTWGLRYIDDLVCRDRRISATETKRLYSLADPNWNVVAVANTSGAVQERFNYSAFGKVNILSGAFATRSTSSYGWTRTFTGQVLDAETGLMLYRNRFYHPKLGRFVVRDPMGYEAGEINICLYVKNSPVNALDTWGLAASGDDPCEKWYDKRYKACLDRRDKICTAFALLKCRSSFLRGLEYQQCVSRVFGLCSDAYLAACKGDKYIGEHWGI